MDGFGEEEGRKNTGVDGWMDLLLPSVFAFLDAGRQRPKSGRAG